MTLPSAIRSSITRFTILIGIAKPTPALALEYPSVAMAVLIPTNLLFKSNNSLKLSEILYDNFQGNHFQKISDNIKDYKKKFSWEYFIQGIDEIMTQL